MHQDTRIARTMRWLQCFLAVLLTLSWRAAYAQTQWPVAQFEVFEGLPYNAADGASLKAARWIGVENLALEAARLGGQHQLDQARRASVPLSAGLKREIESYLGEVARLLQDQGFAAPVLEPVVRRADGREAYRVYYGDFPNIGYAAYSYGCEGEANLRLILVNAAYLTTASGGIREKGYGDLAHELFHAVQRGSAFFRNNCNPDAGEWITEGQAEAVGWDLAWRLRGITPAREDRWGLRRYFERLALSPLDPGPLRNPDDQDEIDRRNAMVAQHRSRYYGSSSLWRFLAETTHARGTSTGGVAAWPTPLFRDVDYRYLARLLQSDTRVAGSRQRELQWLDAFLRSNEGFGLSLARIYPQFLATYMDYPLHRATRAISRSDPGSGDPAQDHKRWLQESFGGCPVLFFPQDSPAQPVSVALGRVTARCLRLHSESREPVIVDIQTQARSVAAAQQLSLGVAGGERVAAALVSENPDTGAVLASWSLQLEDWTRTLDVVITNVANAPGRTLAQDLQIGGARAGWQSNLLQPPVVRARKAARKLAPRPGSGPGSGADAEDAASAESGPASTRLERDDPAMSSCARNPGRYADRCGPSLHIRLQAVPQAMAHMGSIVTSGGFMAQNLETAQRMLQQMPADPRQLVSDERQIALRIPLIDYGFSGTFSDALISVSGGGEADLVSRGPRDVMPGPQTWFPTNASVTIEEYSMFALRGSFSAAMVAAPLPGAHREDMPTLPVVHQLQGRFLVSQPWSADTGFRQLMPAIDSVDEDIAERMPAGLQAPGTASAAASSAAATAAAGAGPGGSGAAPICDCSCAERKELLALAEAMDRAGRPSAAFVNRMMCFVQCADPYAACEQ